MPRLTVQLFKLTNAKNKDLTTLWDTASNLNVLKELPCPYRSFQKNPNLRDITANISKQSIVFRLSSEEEMPLFETVILKTHSLNSGITVKG